jgi:histone deacetylase complex subunit SAP18
MVGASPPILPDPAIGTRLAFRLIYADTRARLGAPPRYVAKDLGSVVLGGGGPGAGPDQGLVEDEPDDGAKTLADARFITGDYISCAILPPNELTGDVVPASSARMGRGAGVGEARGSAGAPPPPPASRERDYGPRGGFRGRGFGAGQNGYGGRRRDRDEPFMRGGGGMPQGEWRRGDMLSEDDLSRPARWGR